MSHALCCRWKWTIRTEYLHVMQSSYAYLSCAAELLQGVQNSGSLQ